MASRIAYFDTSVLLKRYFEEPGSVLAASVLRRHVVTTSSIAPVEAISAICRRRDSGELTPKVFTYLSQRLYRDRSRWELVEVTQKVLDVAEELVDRFNVRTLDAVHLSSGHLLQSALGTRLQFVTADARQREAAEALSFEAVWVA